MAARSQMLALSLLTLALAVGVTASGPTFWTVATSGDFLKGRSDGVFVSLDGVVTAGPSLTNRLQSAPAQVWALAAAPDGTFWVGTGGDGHLLRLRAGEAEQTVFDAAEPNVFAVAVSGTRVFAATGPDGQVQVIEENGTSRVFFDPPEKYIWALAVDREGRLWVGTGTPAVIYRVDANGTAEPVYRPPAAHVVTLAFDSDGRLLAGTDSPGRLYRLDGPSRPFVLLDSELPELRAVTVLPDGSLVAAAVGREGDSSSPAETTSVTVTASSATPAAPGGSSSTAPASLRSRVFHIAVDGTWETLWESSDLVYDVAPSGDGQVLVATGPEGRLYRLGTDRTVSLLTGVDAGQITRFVRRPGSADVEAFATANPGRVISIGSERQSPATYISAVRDTKSVAAWGLIRWESTGTVMLSTRSGNTATPDDSWSDWSAPYRQTAGESVQSPVARFIQWRAVLESSGEGAPRLSAVTLAYLPRNARPTVTQITVHPPGVVFQRPFSNEDGAIAGLDDLSAISRRPPGDVTPSTPPPGRRMFQRGLQTIGWKAEDADGDRLVYTLHYRRDGDGTWRELRAGLLDTIFVWDTTTVADGRYIVRLDASDALSNGAGRVLSGQMESEAITIDNTPPVVTVAVSRNGGAVGLQVEARDAQSAIQKLEYSIAGSAWQLVSPLDGLSDSPVERYAISLSAGQDERDVVVRATDQFQNVTSVPAAR
jgi:hypothetical protein